MENYYLFIKDLVINNHVQSGQFSEQGIINKIKKLGKIPIPTTVVRSLNICRLDKVVNFGIPPSPRMEKQKLGKIPPYSFCRVDMAGPFNVKLTKEVHKQWVILLTCGTIRAVHLEAD